MVSNAENFSTHALSALFILPLGFWFTFNVFFRYYKAEFLQSDSFKSSLSFPWRNRVAIDMYFLGAMAIAGFLGDTCLSNFL
ncbi:unnamed protein product [Allacma fusca]|uniref:Uncharacterized protein n=1 Tax=Allacma fusca TaxID=39272 RepID=A0A8J2KGQ2_9HEXA|nr:unnamed protein product [Allacma fusca]